MIKVSHLLMLLFLTCSLLYGQDPTVGLLSIDEERSFNGYNLIYPHHQSDVFLLNNCGEIVHRWQLEDDKVPGNSVYLLKDGSIVKCSNNKVNVGSIWAGGGGAHVEAYDWEGNKLWSFEQNDSLRRLHHDIEVLPNGNVLMISWELKNLEECIEAGRDPEKLFQDKLWPDYILEYNPSLDSVVWEWHVWDHLIQDYDVSKNNFGEISENSGRVDINYENNLGNPDWNHINSIDYNADLDQILLSVPFFDEIWIIDHSTTLAEARTSSGGNSGKGGDLLFRWGNPLTYQAGDQSDQSLFFQHHAHWIDDDFLANDSLYNQILLFNNRAGENYSSANVIRPVMDSDSLNYKISEGKFLPEDFTKTILHPVKEKLYSSGLSSAQYLPNGNFLILAGRIGYAFEITPDDEIVWEYKLPLKAGMPVEQGTNLEISDNNLFRIKRFPTDYPAFIGKELTSTGTLQIGDDENPCLLSNNIPIEFSASWEIVKNPVSSHLEIRNLNEQSLDFVMLDLSGRQVKSFTVRSEMSQIDLSGISFGVYLIRDSKGITKKFIKL
ncbi:aryl-sulfate sulfotransferase [Portibacter lacus]|nr:aryl-sulfate sulfotransferase [Portibacter lacus]